VREEEERFLSPYRGSILDPYKPYILERWKSGCWNGTQLYHEVKMRGYSGSDSLFQLFISQLRKQHQSAGTASALALDASGAHVQIPADSKPVPLPNAACRPPEPPGCVSASRTGSTRSNESSLNRFEQLIVIWISPTNSPRPLSRCPLEHRDQDLDGWLIQAKQSGIRELKSFTQGIRRDYAAVHAAFTSPWSQGQVEAQVNWRTAAKTAHVRSGQFRFAALAGSASCLTCGNACSMRFTKNEQYSALLRALPVLLADARVAFS
jgi:transposase